MKKLFAILLAMSMLFGLTAIGASATEDEAEPEGVTQAVNWDEFYIIAQPNGQTVKTGESITLRIEVKIPVGVDVTYQWYYNTTVKLEGATEAVLRLEPGDDRYPNFGFSFGNRPFHCEIIGYEKEGDTILSTKKLVSNAQATLSGTLWEILLAVFWEPAQIALILVFMILLFGMWSLPVLLPAMIVLFPFIYILFSFVNLLMA